MKSYESNRGVFAKCGVFPFKSGALGALKNGSALSSSMSGFSSLGLKPVWTSYQKQINNDVYNIQQFSKYHYSF